MKLDDLKTCQVVTFRNGMHGIVFRKAMRAYAGFPSGEDYILVSGGTINFGIFNEDMTVNQLFEADADFDICKVEELNSVRDIFGPYYVPCGNPVWERGVSNV